MLSRVQQVTHCQEIFCCYLVPPNIFIVPPIQMADSLKPLNQYQGIIWRYNFTNSTRRFWALPCGVVLGATGSEAPLPSVSNLEASIEKSLTKADFTDSARFLESAMFIAASPSLSVCPIIFT